MKAHNEQIENETEEQQQLQQQLTSSSNDQSPCLSASTESVHSTGSRGVPECRICRSSSTELRRVGDKLHRVKCACTGSLEHLCAQCYQRYYLEQELERCEICRQPIDIEESNPAARALLKLRLRCRCRPGSSSSDGSHRSRRNDSGCIEGRFLAYACFVLIVFVVVFIIFFVAGEKLQQRRRLRQLAAPGGVDDEASTAVTTAPTRPMSDSERRVEAVVFAAVACINVAIALMYMAWRSCGSCERRRRHHSQFPQQRSGDRDVEAVERIANENLRA